MLLWNWNSPYPLPVVSVASAPVIIGAVYMVFNVAGMVLWKCCISKDKKYLLW